MIEVFKTSVKDERESERIVSALKEKFSSATINFDLEDCDNILRIEGPSFDNREVLEVLQLYGHYGTPLPW